eukprot:PhF_6_TR41051/c0_g1_i1/m.62181
MLPVPRLQAAYASPPRDPSKDQGLPPPRGFVPSTVGRHLWSPNPDHLIIHTPSTADISAVGPQRRMVMADQSSSSVKHPVDFNNESSKITHNPNTSAATNHHNNNNPNKYSRAHSASSSSQQQHLQHQPTPKSKEEILSSFAHDSSLQTGYFLDTTRVRGISFSKAKRFSAANGTAVPDLHLTAAMEELQKEAKRQQQKGTGGYGATSGSVSSRGRYGETVTSHWNDVRGGTAPGPGSYTPRFQALGKPSIISSKK